MGEFNRPVNRLDGLTGHELLQNGWLEQNDYGLRGRNRFSLANPAMALTESGHHKAIGRLQSAFGLKNPAKLAGMDPIDNILINAQIELEAGVPDSRVQAHLEAAAEFVESNGLKARKICPP